MPSSAPEYDGIPPADSERTKRFVNESRAEAQARERSLSALLGFPVATLGLAVALDVDLALDRVAIQFSGILLRELVAVELTGHCERNCVVLDFAVHDFGLIAARTGD